MKLNKELAEKLINFLGKNDSYFSYSKKQQKENFINNLETQLEGGFYVSWSLGGTSNNCWGESYTQSPEIEPNLNDLDDFLIEHYPSISFMQYKLIERAIERKEKKQGDYYGGSTVEAKKGISFHHLDTALDKGGLYQSEEWVNVKDLIKEKAKEKFPSSNNEEKNKVVPLEIEDIAIVETLKNEKRIKKPKSQVKSENPVKSPKKKM